MEREGTDEVKSLLWGNGKVGGAPRGSEELPEGGEWGGIGGRGRAGERRGGITERQQCRAREPVPRESRARSDGTLGRGSWSLFVRRQMS